MSGKPRPCKIGTIPALVVFRYRYKLAVGKVLIVRDPGTGSGWYKVRVLGINPDSHYFFCERV